MMSSLINLKAAGALASPAYKMQSFDPQSDYRALICILLSGGNDSYNMLVPMEEGEYEDYQLTRSNLALEYNTLLEVNPLSGKKYGFHPSMPAVQQMFQDGDLAIVSNVGTLIEPIQNKNDFFDRLTKLPLGLFSHIDQIQQWQTSIPNDRSSLGWGGRMADLLRSSNSNQDISMNISLSGNNYFQSGNNSTEYTISPYNGGSTGIEGFGGETYLDSIKTHAIRNILEQQYTDVFQQTYVDITKTSQEAHELFSSTVNSVFFDTVFSGERLSQSMRMIARTIASQQTLGLNKQIFFLEVPGWDHHAEILDIHASMLTDVSRALGEFNEAMKEIGMHDKVTTFTISDFARTLNSNGNGTDHAWGGNVMVMGGAVKGNRFYGEYPELNTNSTLDFGGGVLIPKISTDEYFAELAMWFGVSASDLPLVLPNINTFYDPLSGVAPLGFLL